MDLSDVQADWLPILSPLLNSSNGIELDRLIESDRARFSVYPPQNQVFRAFHETGLNKVRAVIVGQDPYHGPGQAQGLAFSVPNGVRKPASLKNIMKELSTDMGLAEPISGSLIPWARQGVLLLNTSLTVRAHEPGSHAHIGWEVVTNEVIHAVSNQELPVVFILWGSHAQKKRELIDLSKHFVQESVHPSPLSAYRGFFGSRPFSKTNHFLEERGRGRIDWQL